jgi:hypothetical protein
MRKASLSQFRRTVELTILDIDKGIETIITNLAISFRISKSLTKSGNKGYIEVKNLSQDTRNQLDNTEKILTLKVGYVGEPFETLFYGNISTFFDSYKAPEIITKIECIDGLKSMKDSKVSVSYKSGFYVSQLINKIVNETGWDKKNDILDLARRLDFEDKQLSIGYTHNGLASVAIDELTKMIDIDWSFQDNSIQFTSRDGLATKDVVIVSEKTGLIGVPERTDKRGVRARRRKKKKGTDRTKSEPGYIVRSLIKAKAKPGASIHLISEQLNIDNEFKLGDVEHSGNNYSNLWETRMKALLTQTLTPVQIEDTGVLV